MAHSGSKTETIFNDAPPQPEILRITLTATAKKSTTWQRFKTSMATLSPAALMKYLNDSRTRLEKKIENGEDLTDEEIEFLNQSMEKQLSDVLDKFKTQVMETTKIERTDTKEEMKFKISVHSGLLDWLSKLFKWVVDKIKEIFAKIKEKLEWCFEKAKELFELLWSFFK